MFSKFSFMFMSPFNHFYYGGGDVLFLGFVILLQILQDLYTKRIVHVS